jgi:ketopantoate reductase
MKYGVIGTGAIGGYYGAKLAHSERHWGVKDVAIRNDGDEKK